MKLKCPRGCEFEHDEVKLQQEGYDTVQVGLDIVERDGKKCHDINVVILDQAHCLPADYFTCPHCYEDLKDEDLIKQLKKHHEGR